MNKVILLGRLSREPETFTTKDGLVICTFGVVTNRYSKGENVPSWHTCKAFGKTAEHVANHFAKGTPVSVEGRIEYGKYTNRETGQEVKTTDIMVEKVDFVPKPKRDSSQSGGYGGHDNDGSGYGGGGYGGGGYGGGRSNSGYSNQSNGNQQGGSYGGGGGYGGSAKQSAEMNGQLPLTPNDDDIPF